MQEALQSMKGELVKEQQRSVGMERSRAAFLGAWRENRLRSGAARVIQRQFRAQRVRQLLNRTRLNAKVKLSPYICACSEAASMPDIKHCPCLVT